MILVEDFIAFLLAEQIYNPYCELSMFPQIDQDQSIRERFEDFKINGNIDGLISGAFLWPLPGTINWKNIDMKWRDYCAHLEEISINENYT